MATPSPVANPPATAEQAAKTLGETLIAGTVRVATSWLGLVVAYATAVGVAVEALLKPPPVLQGISPWIRVSIFVAPLLLVLVFVIIPTVLEQRRKWRLGEISGNLKSGYFQLSPRVDEELFDRPDGKHHEIVRWVKSSGSSLLYLTGLSGSGKSSVLAAWVLPNLERENVRVIRLRGYQDPLEALQQELCRPGVIWKKSASDIGELRPLLERACKHVEPGRLLIVLDQFEEFVIVQNRERQQAFAKFMVSLRDQPIVGITILLVFRSDYIGLIEKLSLPYLVQDTNWQEIPPFSEGAARNFIQGSGLTVKDEILHDVLREAADIEQTKGLIRPITMNLCGLVLGRFATGLPRGYRPGHLIRGFLQESITLPAIREVAPRLIPHLITSYVTKQPRSVEELSRATNIDPVQVRGCLRVLGQSDRAIVRPLDAEQQTWEIAHDFLVPLLDSIVARWTVGFWRRLRPWLPWAVAAGLLLASVLLPFWQSDPTVALRHEGWVTFEQEGQLFLAFRGTPSPESIRLISRMKGPVMIELFEDDDVKVSDVSWLKDLTNLTVLDLAGTSVNDVSPLKDLKNLTMLELSNSAVSDLSPLKDLKKLTKLGLSHTGVSDLLPLKRLKNLTRLDLNGTRVSDASPLDDLVDLTTLDLSNTAVSDLSPLNDLKGLTTLTVSNTVVGDVSPLKDLTNLTTLDLSHTAVSDLSPLKDLKKLTTLTLAQYYWRNTNTVRDLSPLEDLTNLTTLDLSGTVVSDLLPLKTLAKLTRLDLTNTLVSEVSPLKSLTNLTTLYFPGTKVSDLAPLKNLNNLTTLNLSSTAVSDLSPLKNLIKLTTLGFDSTKVNNLSPLNDLKNLTHLTFSKTVVSDLAPLNDLTNLNTLDFSNTLVSDLAPLKNLIRLTMLELSNTAVSDLSPLNDLKSLTTLNLSHTSVSDVSPLKGLKNLGMLNLSDTGVADVSPLKNLKNLWSLYLEGTNVRDVSPLKNLKVQVYLPTK